MEAQEFFQNTFCPQFPSDTNITPSKANPSAATADHFLVEDFFDFSNDDDATAVTDATFDSLPTDVDSPTVTPVDTTTNSNFPASAEAHFSGDLFVPYDELAELEWLSKFAEEPFPSEDLQKLQLISGVRAQNNAASSETRDPNPVMFNPQVSVRGKARSKRTRGPPCNWTSRLVVLSPNTNTNTNTTSSSSHSDAGKKPAPQRRREGAEGGSEGRKCLHCATDKTPQWRTGPMGPKTLCNACGVRYKSGRLVPEYRPAASPTFVLTKHSNSHRKVLELRRQKEIVKVQHQHQQHQFLQLQHQQNVMFDVPSSNGEDFLIQQHVGPNFTHLI